MPREKYKETRVADTPSLLALAALAHGRNRSVYEDRLARDVDMHGFHVLAYRLLHNDVEWRTMWFVKIRGSMEPVEIWLDVPLDALDRYTKKMIEEV